MKIKQIRNATIVLEYNDQRILVDPLTIGIQKQQKF